MTSRTINDVFVCYMSDSSNDLETPSFSENWQVIINQNNVSYIHIDAFFLLNVMTWRYKCVFDLWIDTSKPLINWLWEERGRNQHLLWNYSWNSIPLLVLSEYAEAIYLLDMFYMSIVIDLASS